VLSLALIMLYSAIWGSFEGAAAMAGFAQGAILGPIIGGGLALWLALRKQGQHAPRLIAWLGGISLLVIVISMISIANA
jgi:hypothetical protein